MRGIGQRRCPAGLPYGLSRAAWTVHNRRSNGFVLVVGLGFLVVLAVAAVLGWISC